MAIGWLTVLQSVPWTEVISNAPKLAEGAKKLWNKAASNPAPQEAPAAAESQAASPESQAIAALETRARSLEAAITDLHGQMLASSELIKALADQNAQLVARVEANRVRVLWLSVATGVVAVVALIGMVLALVRHGAS